MTARTPEQAAYEARLTARRTRLLCAGESAGDERAWPHLSAAERADEEAGAKAAIAAYIEVNGRDPVDVRSVVAEAVAAPELAAAMAETRGMREKLTAEAHRLDAAAAKAETARDGSRDGTYRMMLDQRAEWCREQAAALRDIAGIGEG